MSEYWKSTPKYWCKYCKTYVRDTPFEKRQHDATPRHQHGIQRSLREIHKTREREEWQKQRAKDEVQRLNGIVGDSFGTVTTSTNVPQKLPGAAVRSENSRTATTEERKKHMVQLAEMGVAIPDEYRREMALAGDWQVLSETSVGPNQSQDDEANPKARLAGVHKRKLPGLEEGDEGNDGTVKRGWGSRVKAYPGSQEFGEDVESLLRRPRSQEATEPSVKEEPGIKNEEGQEAKDSGPGEDQTLESEQVVSVRDAVPPTQVVFKKRKTKAIRQSSTIAS